MWEHSCTQTHRRTKENNAPVLFVDIGLGSSGPQPARAADSSESNSSVESSEKGKHHPCFFGWDVLKEKYRVPFADHA
jgi:hypothetical protein